MLVKQFIRVAVIRAAFSLVLKPQPASHSPTNKALHAGENFTAVTEVEVSRPAFEFAIDRTDGVFLKDVKRPMVEVGADVIPQFLTAFGVRFDVRERSSRTRTLSHVDAETKELETFLPSIQQTRLCFVELQLAACEPAFEAF